MHAYTMRPGLQIKFTSLHRNVSSIQRQNATYYRSGQNSPVTFLQKDSKQAKNKAFTVGNIKYRGPKNVGKLRSESESLGATQPGKAENGERTALIKTQPTARFKTCETGSQGSTGKRAVCSGVKTL